MEAKYVLVGKHPDTVAAALARLRKFLAVYRADKADSTTKVVEAWIDILSTAEDPRYGILVWFLTHSDRRYGTEPWVQALNYANGNTPIPEKGPTQ